MGYMKDFFFSWLYRCRCTQNCCVFSFAKCCEVEYPVRYDSCGLVCDSGGEVV